LPRVAITSFYPKVEFLEGQYLGDGPYNKCYQECDYCRDYKKIYFRNKPVYYDKGAKRKLVSYCRDCYSSVHTGGQIMIADENYGGYYEILDAIKDSGNTATGAAGAETAVISFQDAVKAAFNRTENISYNGSGAEPGVSMLKRYLGCRYRRIADNAISFNDKRLLEFRYKLQYEEPRVKVVSCNDGSNSDSDNTLLLTWNKDYIEE
jgi:hypothetical protein